MWRHGEPYFYDYNKTIFLFRVCTKTIPQRITPNLQELWCQYGQDGVESHSLWMVNLLPPWIRLTRPGANNSTKDTKTAEGLDDKGERHKQRTNLTISSINVNERNCCDRKQPNTVQDDISDSQAPLPSELHGGDWVNHSQVALHTHQDLKGCLSKPANGQGIKTLF